MKNNKFRNKIKMLTLILAAGLSITACGGNDSTTNDVGDTTKTEVTAESEVKKTVSFKEEDLHVITEEISNYVTVDKYKDIPVSQYNYEYTDEDVYEYAKSTLSTVLTEKGNLAEMGDTVSIDFVGKIDGEPFDGGTASFYTVELGSGTLIPGFEEGIVGMDIGDVKDIELTFPEDYRTFGGQDAVFTITLNSITRYEEPTEEQLEDAEGQLSLWYEDYAKQEAKDTLYNTIESSVTYAEDLPSDRYDLFCTAYDNAIVYLYGSKDAFLSGNEWTEEGYAEDRDSYATANTKNSILLDYLAQEYNVTFASDEMQQAMANHLITMGASEGDLTNQYGESAEEILYYSTLHEVITEKLLQDADVTVEDRK